MVALMSPHSHVTARFVVHKVVYSLTPILVLFVYNLIVAVVKEVYAIETIVTDRIQEMWLLFWIEETTAVCGGDEYKSVRLNTETLLQKKNVSIFSAIKDW